MVKKTHPSPEIITLKTRIEELETNYKRVLADYQNQDRRFKEAQGQIIKFAGAVLIEKILPNIDSLEMAQKHLKNTDLEIVIKQLQENLKAEGLQPIESDNKPFDPKTMDCIEAVPGKKNQVVTTLTRGYFLFDKVLRPAKVRVGSGANSHSHESGNLSNSSGSPSSTQGGTKTEPSPPVIARSEATKQSV